MNVDNANVISDATGESTGDIVKHEVNEAYSGAVADPGGNYDSGYEAAHAAAAKTDKFSHPNFQLNRQSTPKGSMFQFRLKGQTQWRNLGMYKKYKR